MADGGAWQRVVDHHGLVTDEGGSLMERLNPVIGWAGDLLGDPGLLDALETPSQIILWGLVISAACAIGYLVFRRLTTRRGPPRRVTTEPLDAPPEDARAAFDQALDRGEPRAALAALVVWLASGLAERGRGRWSAELTNAEIVSSARRLAPTWRGLSALSDLGHHLDRLLYGPVEPTMADVRALVPRAEALLA